MRIRTSKIWKVEKEDLQLLLNTSTSVVNVLEKLGLNGYSGNHRTLHKRIKEDNLSLEILIKNRFNKLTIRKPKFTHEQIFRENSSYMNNENLKEKLVKELKWKYKCAICENRGMHNDLPLSLQLDHINGIRNDHRLANLRFLCPNCHSQTTTFSGKKHKKTHFCSKCANPTKGYGEICFKCIPKPEKIQWPNKEELTKLISEYPMTKLSEKLGVSDVSIRKRCEKHEIKLPPIGYWLRKPNHIFGSPRW